MSYVFTENEGASLMKIAKSIAIPLLQQGKINNHDIDDFIQSLILKTMSIIEEKNFVPKTASLQTFAYRVMKNHSQQLMRELYNHKNFSLNNCINLDQNITNGDSDEKQQQRYEFIAVLNKEKTTNHLMFLQEIFKIVDQQDVMTKYICYYLMENKKISEIEQLLKVSRALIRWRIDKLKIILQDFIKNYKKNDVFIIS